MVTCCMEGKKMVASPNTTLTTPTKNRSQHFFLPMLGTMCFVPLSQNTFICVLTSRNICMLMQELQPCQLQRSIRRHRELRKRRTSSQKKKSILQKLFSHQPRSNCYKWRTFKYILGEIYFALQSLEARRMCKNIIQELGNQMGCY